MSNLDGFGTARMMIGMYGREAQSEARRRCEQALKRDDLQSFDRGAGHDAADHGGVVSRSAVAEHYPVH